MQSLLRTGAIMLALLSGIDLAAAQQTQGNSNTPSMNSPQSPNSSQQATILSPAQKQAVVQGLRGELTQTLGANEQAQIGSKPPVSVSQQALPDHVRSDVPQTQSMLFVKLPDRILLIDPAQQMVTQILLTGDASSGSSSTGPDSGE
jgi:hypothetical protein